MVSMQGAIILQSWLYQHITTYIPRHVIQYTKQCFYSHETWQDSDQDSFSAQAQACAMESLRTLFDRPDGEW